MNTNRSRPPDNTLPEPVIQGAARDASSTRAALIAGFAAVFADEADVLNQGEGTYPIQGMSRPTRIDGRNAERHH